MDGVEYGGEHFVVALGIDKTGLKTVLGFHQGASENQQYVIACWQTWYPGPEFASGFHCHSRRVVAVCES